MKLDDYLSKLIDPEFERHGFTRQKTRKWVNSTNAPIRKLVELNLFRGWTYVFRWGYCVDFIPKCNGKEMIWKKTEKSCEFDLCIDPIDELGYMAEWCAIEGDIGYVFTEKEFEHIISDSIPTIAYDLGKTNTIQDLFELFHERQKINYKRFPMHFYPQTNLALWILNTINGREAEGKLYIDKFEERWKLGADYNEIMQKSLSLAKSMGVL